MTWRGLDDLVPRLHKHVARAIGTDGMPTAQDWLKQTAAAIAVAGFGPVDLEQVGTINVAMLALLSRAAPTTWLCRPSASRVVHETDLRSIPSEPPQMLLAPGIVEARRPETGERLWGDVASLGWYSIGRTYWLIGLSYPDGYRCARWTPQWTGQDLADELPGHDSTALVPESRREEYDSFARYAARYLITLAVLADAEECPLRIELDKRETRDRKRKIIDIFFDGDSRKASARPSANESVLDPARDRVGLDVPVRGHLKRQRYGEGHSLTKWIYVREFQSRRWLSPRWLVSAVGTGEIG